MQQLEIQYFYPLTEQLPLDLDYTNCDKPKLYFSNIAGSTAISSSLLTSTGIGTTSWTLPPTIQFRPTNESVGYWKVGEGLQMHNKKKPNWLHRQMSKIFFGWDWKNN